MGIPYHNWPPWIHRRPAEPSGKGESSLDGSAAIDDTVGRAIGFSPVRLGGNHRADLLHEVIHAAVLKPCGEEVLR
eukprot:7033458-Pyramimonas_sp.AAC.2